MSTTKEEIRSWLKRGMDKNYTHMIVKCDTFDYSDYPVYVSSKEELESKLILENMTKVMEVYNYSIDIETQLNQHRAFNK